MIILAKVFIVLMVLLLLILVMALCFYVDNSPEARLIKEMKARLIKEMKRRDAHTKF